MLFILLATLALQNCQTIILIRGCIKKWIYYPYYNVSIIAIKDLIHSLVIKSNLFSSTT